MTAQEQAQSQFEDYIEQLHKVASEARAQGFLELVSSIERMILRERSLHEGFVRKNQLDGRMLSWQQYADAKCGLYK
jgi:hypothetical protein